MKCCVVRFCTLIVQVCLLLTLSNGSLLDCLKCFLNQISLVITVCTVVFIHIWIIVPPKVLLFFFLHAEKSQNVPETHVSLQCKCHVLMCRVLIASTFGYFIFDLSYFTYSLCVVNSCVSISVDRSEVFILLMVIWSKYPLLLFTQQMVNNSRINILWKKFYFFPTEC